MFVAISSVAAATEVDWRDIFFAPLDSSSAVFVISSAETSNFLAVSITCLMTFCRFSTSLLNSLLRSPISSVLVVFDLQVKSLFATFLNDAASVLMPLPHLLAR